MTRFRFLVPVAILLATPAFAQTNPPTITEAQQVNNGIASTVQFLSALKNSMEQKDALIEAYKTEYAKVVKERDDAIKERDDAIKERDALKPNAVGAPHTPGTTEPAEPPKK
jgi:hypothetical protein